MVKPKVRKPRKYLSEVEKKEIEILMLRYKYSSIAIKYGVSRKTIWQMAKRLELGQVKRRVKLRGADYEDLIFINEQKKLILQDSCTHTWVRRCKQCGKWEEEHPKVMKRVEL